MWSALPHTQKHVVSCDLEEQPVYRYSPCRYRTCNDSWHSATNFPKFSFLFSTNFPKLPFLFPNSPLRYTAVAILPLSLQVQGEYRHISCTSRSLHRKKKVREFPVPSRDVTSKLSLGGNNDVITELFLPRGSLVVTSRLETGNSWTFFYGVVTTPLQRFGSAIYNLTPNLLLRTL